ncbi:hypothetical protein [Paracoccus sp. (in: a-proteobacteria)]|uniref:hypothetical protein n=1 Tax=Paracoccus sp. TaxID=267 RepID=UPI0026DFBFEE|nr:hypothetical protein [Paracoccus sp. (in: a-proteobacteria)]MDO5371166.1 hypothetical protein [Paracoccus sp. (in: a-proteobacteria)]
MTALTQFQRLEATGVWRPNPSERLRDVIVSFGDATLILRDPRSEEPLSHWSLPAVTRLNPGQMPAIFAPGAAEQDEVVEIGDTLMVDAIERVHSAIAASRPHPGRLRGVLLWSLIGAVALAGIVWLPGAVIAHAARIAPPAQRTAVGLSILADMGQTTGAPCDRPSGAAVLDRLSARLLGPEGRIVVLPATMRGARALPGRIIAIGDDMIAGEPGPQVAAGHVLAADLVAAGGDPLRKVLDQAGLRAAISMLTSGELPPRAIAGQGTALLLRPAPRPDEDALLDRMREAGVPSEPYARSLDPSGETVLTLIEADPFRANPPPEPLMSDGEWVQLQQICSR